MNRRDFLLTSAAMVATGVVGEGLLERAAAANTKASAIDPDLKMMDLHVHRSEQQSIEQIVEKSQRLGIPIGVMENVAPWGITTNEQMQAYIDSIRPYPVYVGLQPMSPGWSKNFSKDIIAQADYIAMDPQIVPNGNGYGETIQVWEYATYIDDPEYFMERNMEHYLQILTGDDPLDIFACPLLLPYCIDREYPKHWTKSRLQTIIDAAKSRNIAIEISDMMRVPHEEFILMAKRAGLKFTFGSDTRDVKTGRLDYCRQMAARCGLKQSDLFVPKRKI
jgi:hypothetical protein